jgi:hypothetical protein
LQNKREKSGRHRGNSSSSSSSGIVVVVVVVVVPMIGADNTYDRSAGKDGNTSDSLIARLRG